MSSPISVKRRKLNDATDKLKKPFVSPMRSRKPFQPPMKTPLRDNPSRINNTLPAYVPSTLAHTIKTEYPVSLVKSNVAPSVRAVATPSRKQSPYARSIQSKKTDPEEAAAHKAIMALELQIRRVQNDLDMLKQAESLSNSSTDADLAGLKDKWRLASQCVAEELFGSVKERVCRMGGAAAWREMEKKKHERANGMGEFAEPEVIDDDADCEFDSEGEELPEAEQEYRKKMKHKAKQEALEAMDAPDKPVEAVGAKDKVWQEDGRDDDTFTMDMMLRSLNIELNVIGYDKQLQKWV
ncbi:hypothetical protein Slin14017_G023060 [Septoria linicola]|nr:hypothetical protein Slin14017_G023060 [Septoria linicola]